ncbi:MAG: peptide chain release factor 2 [Bacilli bacterium]
MGGHFDVSNLNNELERLKGKTLNPDFYNDINNSKQVLTKISEISKIVNEYNSLENEITDDLELIDLINEEEINLLEEKIKILEYNTFFSGPYDNLNCYLEIHPGAGGTESCDFAEMLLNMYQKYCDKNNFKYEIIYLQKGDEAGIKSVNMKIFGKNAYGILKNESGIHRIVRISPFDSNKRRHTSFASVNVTPEIKDNIEIEINENDLKIDVYHSSGAGGQSVNTSNSAVRITHLPTKIVVAVQNERSQLRNKEIAMEILKNKLYLLELAKNENMKDSLKNNDSINFGSQIRSYILEPYKLVKDYRTNFESNDPESILDGNINNMLLFNLKGLK